MNEERIREEIANLRLPVSNQPNAKYRYLNYELADQILSIKGIEIRADNQDLPEMHKGAQCMRPDETYKLAQQDMRTPKDGKVWVKCKVKEEQ